MTILRMRGEFTVASNGAGQSVEYLAGFAFVTEFNVPNPTLDNDERWMWFAGGHTDAGPVAAEIPHMRHMIDAKAKRRFNENDDQLIFVVANHDAVATLSFALTVRVLYALP